MYMYIKLTNYTYTYRTYLDKYISVYIYTQNGKRGMAPRHIPLWRWINGGQPAPAPAKCYVRCIPLRHI